MMEYTLEVLLSAAACCRTPFGYRFLNNRWVEGPKLSAVDWMPKSSADCSNTYLILCTVSGVAAGLQNTG